MMLRFYYLEGKNWQRHIVSARESGQNVISSGLILNERGDGSAFFIDIDEGPMEKNGAKVGDDGIFETEPRVKCPVCGASMGESWEMLADHDEAECEDCGTVFDVHVDYTWYYTVKLFKEVPQ